MIDPNHPPFYLVISILMLICGAIELILGIRGRRSNYVFALINSVASIVITLVDQFYGNMAINAYYIIICIVGFYTWGKNRDKNKNVIARKMTFWQIVVAGAVFVLVSIGLNLVLGYFGGHSTVLDSMSTILIVFASVLGVLRYREQWLVWVVADILLLIMWVGSGNIFVIATRIFFVIGSIYGYYNWRKLLGRKRR